MKRLGANRAFSLIELSIVILIIGIIVAGVTQSSRMIEKMAINSARALTSSSPVSGIGDLIAWYDSVSEVSFSSDVDPDNSVKNKISLWNDINPTSTTKCNLTTTQSSNGQTAVNPPILKRNAINNLPAVLFDGSTTYLSCDQLSSYFNGANSTSVFLVYNQTSTPAGMTVLAGLSNSTTSIPAIFFRTQGGNIFMQYRRTGSGSGYVSTGMSSSNNVASSAAYVVNGNLVSAYKDGSLKFSGEVNTEYGNLPLNQFSVGVATRTTSQYFFPGHISEIIIFNRALSAEETSAVNGYLDQKWGIK